MFEGIHSDNGDAKTELNELQGVPEIPEIGAFLLLDLLDAAVEEIQGEAAVEDLEEDDDDSESTNIAL